MVGVSPLIGASEDAPALDPGVARWVDAPDTQSYEPELAIPFTVFDDEDRVETVADRFPWACICRLKLNWRTGVSWGTGWLVAPRLVLTAGHNLHRGGNRDLPYVGMIDVTPGQTGGRKPFGTQRTGRRSSVNHWTAGGHRAFDIGAIWLEESFPGMNRYIPFDVADGTSIYVAGYPEFRPGGEQGARNRHLYRASGRIMGQADGRIYYRVDTETGQSGSPVLQRQDGGVVSVGVHTVGDTAFGDDRANSATALHDGVRPLVAEWLSRPAAHPPNDI